LARLISRAQFGERDALAALYGRYWQRVYRYVRTIVRDGYEAEDVTQQVFIKLMLVISHYRRGSAPFIVWLLRVAHNVAIDHLRERRPTPSGMPWKEPATLPDGNPLCSPEIREVMASLPGEQRRVVMLRHIVGLSPPEIAAQMGKSESSVHGLHHRGRQALKWRLAERQLTPVTAAPR
jgi:RNA polymerase sigma-70 factor, ECF subfamily